MPPIGIDLTPTQALAAAFRILVGEGFSEHISGHITVRDDETGNLWVNPWGLWWDEVTASDVCVVSPDATKPTGSASSLLIVLISASVLSRSVIMTGKA